MMFQRIMAVLAAVFLVGAVTIGLVVPPNATLGAALYMMDPHAIHVVQAHLAAWIWSGVAVPLLLRPAWLLPTCIGIVCAGMSLTLASQRPQRTPRRRL